MVYAQLQMAVRVRGNVSRCGVDFVNFKCAKQKVYLLSGKVYRGQRDLACPLARSRYPRKRFGPI